MEAPAKTLGRRGARRWCRCTRRRGAWARLDGEGSDRRGVVARHVELRDETTSLNFTKADRPERGGGAGDAFEVAFGDGSVRVPLGAGSLGGTGVFGQVGKPRQSQPWTTAAAGWFTGGEYPGAIGISDSHIGVIGLSGPVAPISPTSSIGRRALRRRGRGFRGVRTQRLDAGRARHVELNVGLVGATGGATEDDDALYSLMASGVHGIGAREPGVCGRSETIGVLGESHGIGMWGAAGPTEVDVSQVPAFSTGVWGQGTGQSVGVLGNAPLIGVWGAASLEPPGPPILPAVQTPSWALGPRPTSRAASACLARHQAGGAALAVEGRASFTGVGGGTLDRRGDAFIGDPHISADSHVIVTLQGDPGKGAPWVEVMPGKGFVVHMTEAANKRVPFSYLVLDAREAANRT